MSEESAKIGTLLELVIDHRGKTPKKLGGDFTPFGIPVVSAIHIKNGQINWGERERYVSSEMFERWMPIRLKKEDILLTSEAPLGEVAFVENDEPLVLSQRLFALRCNPNMLNARYFKHFLSSSFGQQLLAERASGSTVVGIKQSELLDITIPYPSMAKQIVIGDLLEEISEKIRCNEAIANKLQDVITALFKSWFIDFEPAGNVAGNSEIENLQSGISEFFPKTLIDSELGKIPVGWEVAKLSDLLTNVKSKVSPGPETLNLPYVPIDRISARNIFLHTVAPSEAAQSSLIRFEKGDVLFGAMRPYFHKVCSAPFSGVTRTTTFVLRPNKFPVFSLLCAFQDSAIAHATAHSQGSTIPYAIWDGGLADFKVVVPPNEVLTFFEEKVGDLVELAESLIAENKILSKLKTAMLPRLISGDLPLPEELLGK